MTTTPRVVDNDRDEISVMLEGKELRGWLYRNEDERRLKMLLAREFVEGWYQAADIGARGHEFPNERRDLTPGEQRDLAAVLIAGAADIGGEQ